MSRPYIATPHMQANAISVYRTPDPVQPADTRHAWEHDAPVRFYPAWRERENVPALMSERPRMRISAP